MNLLFSAANQFSSINILPHNNPGQLVYPIIACSSMLETWYCLIKIELRRYHFCMRVTLLLLIALISVNPILVLANDCCLSDPNSQSEQATDSQSDTPCHESDDESSKHAHNCDCPAPQSQPGNDAKLNLYQAIHQPVIQLRNTAWLSAPLEHLFRPPIFS